ncbi:MAG: DISARM system helicase DrmA [Rhodomicrobium sp.]
MSANIKSVEVRTRLVDILRRDLVGPAPHDTDIERERLDTEPSRWYLTGFIAPGVDAPEATAEEEARLPLRESDTEYDPEPEADGAPEDRETDELRTRRRAWRPMAIGITVLVPKGVKQVEAVVTWGDYRTEPPIEQFLLTAHEEPGTPDTRDAPDVEWVRTPRRETTMVPIPNGRGERTTIVPNSATPQLPGGALELAAHARRYAEKMPDGTTREFQALTVFLVNKRKRPRRKYEDVAFAFQARLELKCADGFLPRFDHSGYGTDDWDRRVADLHYADACEYAVGRNTSAEWDGEVEGKVTRVATCPLPLAEVERVAPQEERELPGVEFGMEALANAARAGAAKLAAELRPLPVLYEAWIAKQWESFTDPAKHRRCTADQLVKNARRAKDRIAEGIRLLETDDNACLAFHFMNDAIAKAARKRSPHIYPAGDPKRIPKWRPFQLAFILLNLAGIVDKTHKDRETVDLLFFPTGGGKTEAYLGLAAFTIAHRRITNTGLTGAGVSIIMRYTLRLLTLDQLGRAAGVMCALELSRLDKQNIDASGRKLLGDWPIEIGLWVGQGATPNRMGQRGKSDDESAYTRVLQYHRDKRRYHSPVPLKQCPWCGTDFEQKSFNCVPAGDPKPKNLAIQCMNPVCDFNGEERSLPIVVVDEPIYRRLPAFIVATVDKFASLPWAGESGAFFDHVDRYDTHGFLGAAQEVGGQKLPGSAKLLPPDLIIQDELHLISGPLGTIAGLYETAIDALATRQIGETSVRPKVVASTATVRRAATQIKALFDRDATEIFPPPGLSRRDSFFAVTEDTKTSPARMYLGIAAQGRGPKLIFLRVLQTIMAAAKAEYERLPPNQRAAVDPYMSALCYFNALKELGGARRIVDDEVRSGLVSYGRSRRRVAPPDQPFQDREIGEVLELTSRESTDKVAEAKNRLEQSFGGPGAVVDVALATNMISVGLDITRLGLMVVQGQPKTAAEYIQATSRVGRDHNRPGLVITVLNLMKPRDRTHFEHFTQFHRTFYRAVEATSVTPWASRALDRSLAALVVSLARHLERKLAPESQALEFERRPGAAQVARDVLLRRAGRSPVGPAGGLAMLDNAITELVNDWISVAEDFRGDSLSYGGNGNRLLSYPLDPRVQNLKPEHQRFAAARSMRDVEPNVQLKLRDPYGQSLSE